jgi:hypothetical protein
MNKMQKKVYDQCMYIAPVCGNAIGVAYYRGIDSVDKPEDEDSREYAAWMAGRDTAKAKTVN